MRPRPSTGPKSPPNELMAYDLHASRHRLALTAVAAIGLGAGVLATDQSARAAGPYPDGATGFDISWPQCGHAYPPAGVGVAIVGVDDGIPFSASAPTMYSFTGNPCLASEWQWASTSTNRPSVYLNTNFPHGVNAGQDPYTYGWKGAAAGVSYALSNGAIPAVWWLDVETTNYWPCNSYPAGACPAPIQATEAQVVQGNIDYLHSRGYATGIYSTPYQFQLLMGGYAPGVPNWTADYNDSQAWFGCTASHAFGGGVVWQVQSAPGTFDPDYSCPSQHGYYLVAGDGGLFPFGDAVGYGSMGSQHLNRPIVGIAVSADSHGYWLVAADGGIFPFGNAVQHTYGSTGNVHLNQPIVGMALTASGNGYWLVAADGGIFPFGDALQHSYGSTGNIRLNAPIVGAARTASGNGYWLVAADGGIFPFGDALQHSYGSTGGMSLAASIVGMAPTKDGSGYWLVAADGGVFPFGDAAGYGSAAPYRLGSPIVGMMVTESGQGYLLVSASGAVVPFGDAQSQVYGTLVGQHLNTPVLDIAATA